MLKRILLVKRACAGICLPPSSLGSHPGSFPQGLHRAELGRPKVPEALVNHKLPLPPPPDLKIRPDETDVVYFRHLE